MGRRRAEEIEDDEDLDEDLDETEELDEEAEEVEEDPAPRRAAAKPRQAGVPKPSPEETRALDLRIFAAADKLQAKLGRPATQLELAVAAKVPGGTDDARRVRVAKALRRRGLLTAPAAKPVGKAAGKPPRPAPKPAPPAPAKPRSVAPTLIEALVAERTRLAGIVARLDATIADLGGES